MASIRAYSPALAFQTEPVASRPPRSSVGDAVPGHPGDSNAAGGWQERGLTPWPSGICSQVSPPSFELVHLLAPSSFSLPLPVPSALQGSSQAIPAGRSLSARLPELPQLLLPGTSVSSRMKGDQNSHIMGFTSSEVMHLRVHGHGSQNYWYWLRPTCWVLLVALGLPEGPRSPDSRQASGKTC